MPALPETWQGGPAVLRCLCRAGDEIPMVRLCCFLCQELREKRVGKSRFACGPSGALRNSLFADQNSDATLLMPMTREITNTAVPRITW